MLNIADILVRPRITEKSTKLREKNGYVIEVHPTATKGDIRQALQIKYKVDVLSVRTIKIVGKYRRRSGPFGGYQSDRKKAIVTLKPGQQIKWEEVA